MPGKAKKYTLGQASDLHDVTLPSGATCQARRPGVQGLISAGLLDSFDDLTALIKTEHIDKHSIRGQATVSKVTPVEAKNAVDTLMADKEKLATAFHMVDRLVISVVTQPAVWIDYQLKDETDEDFAERARKARVDEAIPVRAVDLDDKMFLVNWAVGGSSDLTAFREGREQLMADVASSQEV